MPGLNFPNLLEQASAAAVEAGSLLLDFSNKVPALDIANKTSGVDLVSQADVEAEKLLQARLKEALPEAGFLGEESGSTNGGAELTWVVDPLDGTSNFLASLPVWSVSIGLCKTGLDPILGIVHSPALGFTWSAAEGLGAWCNGKKVSVRTEPPGGGLKNAMLATGFPYTAQDRSVELFSTMQLAFHKIRRMGSAAIDMALIAQGVFDGMWELGLKPWDTAAGVALIREAGGIISRMDGSPYTPGDTDLLAASTVELHGLMTDLLGQGANY